MYSSIGCLFPLTACGLHRALDFDGIHFYYVFMLGLLLRFCSHVSDTAVRFIVVLMDEYGDLSFRPRTKVCCQLACCTCCEAGWYFVLLHTCVQF